MKRAFLAAWLCLCAASPLGAQGRGTDAGGYEVIANAFGFGVDIPGCEDASKNVREILIDELNIDVRELTTGLDVEYRRYRPGQPHYGNATLKFALSPDDTCLTAWLESSREGKNVRKNITINLFKDDRSTVARSYNLIEAFPLSFSGGDFSTGQLDSLTVEVGGVAFDGGGRLPTNAAPLNDIIVQTFTQGAAMTAVDGAWESCTGGALAVEVHPATFGADAGTKRSHMELTLRGPMTASRNWLAQWLTEAAGGADTRRMLRCARATRRGQPGHGYACFDVFVTGYVFPQMSSENTTGNVMEEVRLKPIRCELK